MIEERRSLLKTKKVHWDSSLGLKIMTAIAEGFLIS